MSESADDFVSGGEITVRTLERIGVSVIFCVASMHNLPILNAAARRGTIRTINVRHEQAAVHAADAYARVTGQLGVALTSTGPGAANSVGGLFEAQYASSPVLMLTGQVESKYIGKNGGYLHQADQQAAMLATVTKQTLSVRHVDEIATTIAQAARSALSGRAAPAAVEIPIDLQFGQGLDREIEWQEPARLRPAADAVGEAARLLGAARRPLIWAGGGVIASGAWSELSALARHLHAPVLTSLQGRGALRDDDPLSIGSLTTSDTYRELYQQSDLILAVGTHFQAYPTDFWQIKLPTLVHIDVDPTVIDRAYRAELAVIGDARECLKGLLATVGAGQVDPGWADRCRVAGLDARKAAYEALEDGDKKICDSVRKHLPENAVIVRDSTIPGYRWAVNLLPVCAPRTLLRPDSAAIGPGLPLGIGAAVATNSPVTVIHGDGGLMLSIGELATAAQYQLPIVLCVFNNQGYGVLRNVEKSSFGGALHDVDLFTPDFATVARGMGWTATRIRTPESFDEAFASAVAREAPTLIEVDMAAIESA